MTEEEFIDKIKALVDQKEINDLDFLSDKMAYEHNCLLSVSINRCVRLLKHYFNSDKFFIIVERRISDDCIKKDEQICEIFKQFLGKFECRITHRQAIGSDYYRIAAEFTKVYQSTKILSKL